MLTFHKDEALPAGEWGQYIKITPTPMLQMDEDFSVETPEGTMQGYEGDFLAVDPQGGMSIISADVHALTYVRCAKRNVGQQGNAPGQQQGRVLHTVSLTRVTRPRVYHSRMGNAPAHQSGATQ